MVELSDDIAETEKRRKWISLLKKGDFFSTFSDEYLNKLLDFGQLKRYAKDEYIIKESANNTSIFVIVIGQASIIKNTATSKTKKQISTIKTGECFGEMALWLDGLRTASVLATLDCYVYILSREDLEKMDLELQNKVLQRIARAMALKIIEDTDRLAKTPFF